MLEQQQGALYKLEQMSEWANNPSSTLALANQLQFAEINNHFYIFVQFTIFKIQFTTLTLVESQNIDRLR